MNSVTVPLALAMHDLRTEIHIIPPPDVPLGCGLVPTKSPAEKRTQGPLSCLGSEFDESPKEYSAPPPLNQMGGGALFVNLLVLVICLRSFTQCL